MLRPIKSCLSLRALLVVMIAAPILPTLALTPAILMQLGRSWHQLSSPTELVLLGAGVRLLGGGLALAAAGRLIRSMRALSRAAQELSRDGAPAAPCSGIVEIDTVIQALAVAARSLGERAEKYEKAEAGRRDSEARLRAFAESGSDWYWESDRDHRFCYFSDHMITFGQDPSRQLGRTRWELASDSDRDTVKWVDHRALLERHEPFRDFRYARKIGDQPEQTVSVSGRPIVDSAGKFSGYRGTARDISEEVRADSRLREAKAEAEAASLAKSQFLANVSHELRTPLNAILGFSEMLDRGAAGSLDPRQREYVGYIRQSGAHLLDIINEILDLAKIDAGKLELNEERGLDARALADSCVALVSEGAATAGIVLATEFEAGLPPLIADGTRLKQILLNLLGNAVKFTEPGGSVMLAGHSANDGGVEFEIRDTGLGMTAAEIGIAIEPFGQVDAGLARRREGTGLGLPLARRLTERHGGSFTIESVKGRGTRVVVGLPPSRVIRDGKFETLGTADGVRFAAASPLPVG
jgi:two-component system cell cycle sensor histidine kinase PleC